MKAEDRAAEALARHYDIAGGTDQVRLRCPKLHEIVTKEIEAAEARGYDRAKVEAYDNGYKVGYESARREAKSELTVNVDSAKLRQAIDDGLLKLNDVRPSPAAGEVTGVGFVPCTGFQELLVILAGVFGLPAHLVAPPEPIVSGGPQQTFECVAGFMPFPGGADPLYSLTQAPPEPDYELAPLTPPNPVLVPHAEPPLFFYFEGVDPATDGATGLRFVPVDDVATHLAGEFCVPRPCGVGFRGETNLEVTMRRPENRGRVVDHVRDTVRQIINNVIAERDQAWSVALADAGFDLTPITPEYVEGAVAEFERSVEAARDGEWSAAFSSATLAQVNAGEAVYVPFVPTGVECAVRKVANNARRSMVAHADAKAAQAAFRARDRELVACFRLARTTAITHLSRAEQLPPGRERNDLIARAHGVLDVAQALLDRDATRPDRQAPAGPRPQGH